MISDHKEDPFSQILDILKNKKCTGARGLIHPVIDRDNDLWNVEIKCYRIGNVEKMQAQEMMEDMRYILEEKQDE